MLLVSMLVPCFVDGVRPGLGQCRAALLLRARAAYCSGIAAASVVICSMQHKGGISVVKMRLYDAYQVQAALRLAQAQVGPETGGHLNAAPRTNDSTRIARNR